MRPRKINGASFQKAGKIGAILEFASLLENLNTIYSRDTWQRAIPPMKKPYLRTSDLAKAVGIHPNTVRLYEAWGFLPKAERSPAGYRRFTGYDLDQLRLVRLIFEGGWPGHAVRKTGLAIIQCGATGDLGGALELAHQMVAQVQAERAQAEAAAAYLERWAAGAPADVTGRALRIGDAARLLNTTVDAIRNWERNGLLDVPRDPANGYRLYGAPEIGRLRVIRMLLRAGYSMMAILRMLTALDDGQTENLRQSLDTPRADEDVFMVNDRWLSALAEMERQAQETIAQIEAMLQRHGELL
ncbi:MAG: MerR family transcriptional regulator [Chloroflexota bacterium]